MRSFMTSALGIILVLAGIAVTASAANFTDTSSGISIDVDDTLSKQPRLRDIQYFKSEDRSSSLMIKQIHDLSIVDFLTELRNVGYRDRRDGVFLEMTGKPNEAEIESGRGLLMPVTGLVRGQPIRGVVGAYSGHDGQGFLVIGTAKPEHWAAWKPRMKAMFESIRLVKIDRQAMVKGWEKRLKDKKLQHKQANVGGAVHLEYHLCSDGTVVRESGAVGQMSGSNIPDYGNNTQQKRGMWRVIVSKGAPYLIVRDRREHELMLEDEGDNFLLSGNPYTITASDLCN